MRYPAKIEKQWLSLFVFLISAVVTVLVCVFTMASHVPYRIDQAGLTKLLQGRRTSGAGSWRAVHILAGGCACSRAVAQHLIARGSLAGLEETVIVAGKDSVLEHELTAAHISVEAMPPAEASEKYKIHGAPWLVFVAPGGEIRYAGGYATDRNATAGYEDVRLWSKVRRGLHETALPAYGCAVGRHLQEQIDPLGLKYGN